MKKMFYKIISVFFALLLIVNTTSSLMRAVEQKCSLGIRYEVEDAEFRLYKIGELDDKGNMKLSEAYQEYHVSLENDFEEVASALEAFIKRDQKVPDAYSNTDKSGYVSFENLKKGIYLLLSNRVQTEEFYYEPAPVMVTLPAKSVEDESLLYDVVVDMKFDKIKKEDMPEKINMKVMKVWKNDDSESRPKSITAVLLKDGIEYEKVELSSKNNWQYQWKKLSTEFGWDVIEDKVPEYYTLGKSKSNETVILTNTFDDDDDSDKPSKPGGDEDDKPNKKPPKVPDSGQLWWPIPILVVGGLFLVVLGVMRRQKEEINEA